MKMSCVNVLFDTHYFDEKKDRLIAFHEVFVRESKNDNSRFMYYKHALFENLDYSNEQSSASNGTNDFILAKINDGYQKSSKTSEGIQVDCAVLMLSYDFNETESFREKLNLFDVIMCHVNKDEINFDHKIPLVVLFISPTGNHQDIRSLFEPPFDIDQLLRYSNRFIHFMFGVDNEESYKRCMTRIASIGIVLSPKFDLSSLNDKQLDFVQDSILFEKYQSNRGVEKNKNIAHLIAKMDVAWAVNCICNKFPPKHVFRLFMEKEKCARCIVRSENNAKSNRCPGFGGSYCSSQNPLMIAAIHSKKAVLASFMNFYSSNIDMTELHNERNSACYNNKDDVTKDCMYKELKDDGRCNVCIVKQLLHQTDSRNKNLTFHIITAQEQCLGAYGTILQFEEDFHIRKSIDLIGKEMNMVMNKKDINQKNQVTNDEDVDKDYLRLQTCIQKYVGSSLKSTQVLSLFEATRKPKRISIMITVAYALLGVYLFQMGLYLMDVITDSLVAKDYYKDWRTPNSSKNHCQWNPSSSRYVIVSGDNTANVTALSEYPDCLSDMWKFLYTTGFMVLPTLFYLIEMLRHYKKILGNDKMDWRWIPIGVIIFPLLTLFWPLILFIWKSYPLVLLHWESGPKRRHYLELFERISLIVLVVHLIEVCIESSFMAILQWYTVMPEMLNDFHSYLIEEQDSDPSISLSKISFLFSILSLAWGFTTYSAEQKDGALDMTFNPSGRILLFISNLCLIFARINSLVLFMYYWGPGEFKPGMFWIFVHVIVMMLVHYYTLYYKSKHEPEIEDINPLQIPDRHESLKNEKEICQANDNTTYHTQIVEESKNGIMYYFTVFYVCVVNGLANIFINNFVNISLNRFKHIGAKKKKTFHRQICGDLLFFLQNVIMVGLGLTIDVKPMNNPVTAASVAAIIFGCHFLGLSIKVVYYKYFHIWKDLTPRITTSGVKRGLEKSEFKKNIKKNIRKYSVKSK